MMYYGERVIGMGILRLIMFLSDIIIFMFNLLHFLIIILAILIQPSIAE